MRAAKVQASLRIRAVSPEPSLLAHTSSESRGTFRQKARSLAPLNGWACAVRICHDGMLEDTNSLDGAHLLHVHMTRNTQIHTCVNVNILLHWVRPSCISTTHVHKFTRVCIRIHIRTFTYVCKIYIHVKFTYVCKSAHVNCTLVRSALAFRTKEVTKYIYKKVSPLHMRRLLCVNCIIRTRFTRLILAVPSLSYRSSQPEY